MKKISIEEFNNYLTDISEKYETEIELDDEEYQWLNGVTELYQSDSGLENIESFSDQELEFVSKNSFVFIHFVIDASQGYELFSQLAEKLHEYNEDIAYCLFVSRDTSLPLGTVKNTIFYAFS